MQALTATAIALSVAAVGVQGYVQNQAHTVRQALGKAQGVQMDRLAAAVDNYAIQNFSRLTGGPGQILKSDGVTPGTVVTPLLPTVQELVTLGYLQGAFNSTNFFGGGYAVSLGRIPVGCSYPNCALGGTVSMTNAILRGGVPDAVALGAATQQVGADAGFSPISAPGTISGISGGWSLPNPAGSVAGILAERVGQGSQRYNTFVRRDGALPMTGALNLGGNAITALQTAASGSTCATQGDLAQGTNGVVLSCQGGQWKTQGSMYWQDPVTSYAVLTGGAYPCNAGTAYQTRVVQTPSVGSGPRIFGCDGASWQPLALDDNGNLTVAGTLTMSGTANMTGTTNLNGAVNLNITATEGAACTGNGVAQNGAGLILSCQSGTWHTTTDISGYFFYLNGYASPQFHGIGRYNAMSQLFTGWVWLSLNTVVNSAYAGNLWCGSGAGGAACAASNAVAYGPNIRIYVSSVPVTLVGPGGYAW